MIRSHEKTTVTRGEILLDRMEEEITLLRKKHTDLEKLSHTDDHIHFLQVTSDISDGETLQVCLLSNPLPVVIVHQGWQSLSGPSGYEDLNKISVAPYYSFDATKRAIAALKIQVEEASKMEMSKISGAGEQMHLCLLLSAGGLILDAYENILISFHSEGSLHHAGQRGKDEEGIPCEGWLEGERNTKDERRTKNQGGFHEMWVIVSLLACG